MMLTQQINDKCSSVQNLKGGLNEIERKIAALQNNMLVMLNKLEEMIREVHRAE